MKSSRTPKIVGVTGSIGSGKSTVAHMFEKLGAYRIDADEIAAEVLRPATKVFSQVKKSFGSRILTADKKSIDRHKLAEVVFRDSEAREKLNALTHPAIVEKMMKRVEEASKKQSVIVLDIPLLLERGSSLELQPTVVVYSDLEIRRNRIQEKTGWSPEHIEQRMAAQRPLLEKVSEAQFVINNSGSLGATQKQVQALWPHLRGQ
ncbi:MAG: dephospho-CoA kinase [Deltaproteobacteria bacterium]|nr:dephospho-CoA kinase [Deltaproteobacteria bacterium]